MSSTSETGHIINVGNAKVIISYCKGMGAEYQPSNALISIANMEAKVAEARNLQKQYNLDLTAKMTASNSRLPLVKALKDVAKKSLNSFESGDADEEIIKDVKGLVRKITGSNVRKKRDKDHVVLPHQKSNSELDMPHLMENFATLLSLYAISGKYAPNENNLKLTSMEALLDELRIADKNVIDTSVVASNSKIRRDFCLYELGKGLVDMMLICKKYVRSVYGARSEKAKMVVKVKLRRVMKMEHGEGM